MLGTCPRNRCRAGRDEVVRVGDTVRRPRRPTRRSCMSCSAVRAARLAGAPRFLGTDEQGREVLTFLDGHVAWAAGQPAG